MPTHRTTVVTLAFYGVATTRPGQGPPSQSALTFPAPVAALGVLVAAPLVGVGHSLLHLPAGLLEHGGGVLILKLLGLVGAVDLLAPAVDSLLAVDALAEAGAERCACIP